MTNYTRLEIAKTLVHAGIKIFPIEPSTKTPRQSRNGHPIKWSRFAKKPASDEQLRQWFGKYDIGAICGEPSAKLLVIDIDNPDIIDAFVNKVGDEHPDLYDDLVEIKTRSGKRHLWLLTAEPFGARQTFGTYGDGKDAIEFRADGCYVVGPGSDGYEVIRGGVDDLAVYSPVEVDTLIRVARSFEPKKGKCAKTTTKNATGASALSEFGESGDRTLDRSKPGYDFELSVDWAYILTELLDPSYTLVREDDDSSRYWLRPGGESEWSVHTGLISVAGRDLMHVFSTGCEFFQANETYSKFGAYAAIFHDGDCREAAKDLREQGYGQQDVDLTCAVDGIAKPMWPDPPADDCFHGPAGEFAQSIRELSECDPLAVLVQTLVAMGNLIGRGPYFRIERDRHFTKLFVVIVGPTGSGRKGTSLGYVHDLIDMVDPSYRAVAERTGLTTGAGMIHEIRDPSVKTKDGKETIVDPGKSDKRLLCHQTEFAGLLRVMKRQNNDLSHIIRDAWDDRLLQNMSKNSAEKATHSHVCIVGHITPRELSEEMDATDFANGFGNRYLYFAVRRTQSLPHGGQRVDDDHLEKYAKWLRRAVKRARTFKQVTWDGEARDGWEAVYPALSEPEPTLVGELLARGPAQVLRLSLIYALLDGQDRIGLVHLRASLALWEYVERTVRYVFQSDVGTRTSDKVVDTIDRAFQEQGVGTELTRSYILRRLFQGHVLADRVDRAMRVLTVRGDYVAVDKSTTGGRPAKGWRFTG